MGRFVDSVLLRFCLCALFRIFLDSVIALESVELDSDFAYFLESF
ncbi:hypothetical protein [uncultured Helicobacter sp.]